MSNEPSPKSPDKNLPASPPPQSPPAEPEQKDKNAKPNPPPRKRGPSVDIGPCSGPGSDVVATPPRQL